MRCGTIGQSRGFTLVELMVVVMIVAVLTSIAVPSYLEQVRKSRRAEAKTQMLEAVQCMERFQTTNSTYVGGPARCAAPANEYYVLAFADVARNTFTLSATAQGSQVDDRCGNLGINHAGAKTHSAGTPADLCW